MLVVLWVVAKSYGPIKDQPWQGIAIALCVALLIAPPYDEVYIHFLYMQTDQRLGEIDRYNNDAALYNQGMLEARQAYNREHMPLQGSRLRNIFPIYDPPRDSNDPLA